MQDMKKIPALALIELTALCDVLGLDLKRSKAGKRKAAGQQLGLIEIPVATVLGVSSRELCEESSAKTCLAALLPSVMCIFAAYENNFCSL